MVGKIYGVSHGFAVVFPCVLQGKTIAKFLGTHFGKITSRARPLRQLWRKIWSLNYGSKNFGPVRKFAVVFLRFSRGKLSQNFREPIWEDNFPRQASRGPPCKPCKLDASLHVVAGVAGNFCTTGCFVKILVCAGVWREVQTYLGFLLGCCPSAFLIDESDRVRHGASPKPRGLGTGLGEESIQSTRSNAGFGRSLALTCWVCSSLRKVGDLRCESPFSLRGSGAWLCYGVRGATRTSASCTSSPAVGCTAGGLQ